MRIDTIWMADISCGNSAVSEIRILATLEISASSKQLEVAPFST